MRTSKEPHFHTKQSLDYSSPSRPSLGSMAPVPQSHQWGGIADLKSLIHHMIKGTPVKELPPVPDIPALFTDSIYRVCGAPPGSLCTMSHVATAVIHLFPLSHGSKVGLTGGQSSVTYGLLSKVLSPKETRERAKQATEKKNAAAPKAAAAVDEGDKPKDEKPMVVRVVCHDTENLAGKGRSRNRGDIHSGKVWVSEPLNRGTVDSFIHPVLHISCINIYQLQIPPPLALRWNVIPHSTVRIKPVKSAIKVASLIRLQPLTPLVSLMCKNFLKRYNLCTC